jgi:hypothetical protein
VNVALETDRGLLVVGLRAAGHRVFAINPKAGTATGTVMRPRGVCCISKRQDALYAVDALLRWRG